jgi:recombination protein RecA
MGDSHVGLHARLMSQALRKLTSVVAKSNTLVIFINQLREKVGVIYGNPEVTTGGRALKFYSTIRIDVRKSEQIKGTGSEILGSRTKCKVVKNKVAPPFKTAEFDIMYGTGISKTGEMVDIGVMYNVIQKSGAWFSYGDMRLGQGRENVKAYFEQNPEFAAEIEEKIRVAMKKGAEDEKATAKTSAKTSAAPRSVEAAKARLDVMVDDDD